MAISAVAWHVLLDLSSAETDPDRERTRDLQILAAEKGASLYDLALLWRDQMSYTARDRTREECVNGGEP